MENQIISYLSKYVSLTDEVKKAIIESSLIRTYKKGTVLLTVGAISNESYLVMKGCVRSYYLMDGIERTTAFYTEECPIAPLVYGKNTPSDHYLECLEETIACVCTPDMEVDMFKRHPEVESVCRIMAETFLNKNQQSFDEYVLATPEDRYLHLLNTRPDLFQRVPQYQIASYLGIKPESLSRIKKRLMETKK